LIFVNGLLVAQEATRGCRRFARKLVLALSLCTLTAWGQLPRTAGKAPLIEGSVGYCYLNLGVPESGRLNLHGADVNVTADFHPRFGVTLDASYARAADVFQSGRHADVLSYMAGPVVYPMQHKRITVYMHVLLGGARVGGAVPHGEGTYLVGFTNRVAGAGGGGVQYRYSPRTKFQLGVDYLHTAMFGPNYTVQGVNNLRAVASIVWLFGKRKDY